MNFPMRVYKLSVIGNSSTIAGSIDVVNSLRCLAILLISIALLFISTSIFAQTQIGADIDGNAAYDESGRPVSLSADGSRLAIGASGNDAPFSKFVFCHPFADFWCPVRYELIQQNCRFIGLHQHWATYIFNKLLFKRALQKCNQPIVITFDVQ